MVLDIVDRPVIEAPDAQPAEDDQADGCHQLFRDVPSSVEFNKLRKRLLRQAREAIDGFGMVRPGERWLVALSGGKDSYGLLAVLLDLKWRGLLPVDLLACNLDQGQPNFPKHILPDFLDRYEIPHRIEYRDTYSIVTDKIAEGSTYCSLCSRLRRGHLYRVAREEGCSSLVLGHHREDILETFFMNFFHGGRLAAMPPKLLNDEGDVMVLRPLAFCAEADLARFADAMRFPIIPCDLCGSQDGLQRNAMKVMIDDIEKKMPGRKDTMIRALANVRPSHLLDRSLFDFAASPDNSENFSMHFDDKTVDWLTALLAEAATVEIMPRWRRLGAEDIRQKTSATDLVTEADVNAERFITARLKERFPTALVVGEEAHAADASVLDGLGDADLAFVLDPVDGTLNFASGMPLFGVMLAVVVKGETVAGIIHDPVGKDFIMAVKGGGAHIRHGDGRLEPCRVALALPVSSMNGAVSWHYTKEPERSMLARNQAKFNSHFNFRCAAHEYRLLATGNGHFVVYMKLMPWDHLPGTLIHAEAGGYSARLDGSAYLPSHVGGGLLAAPDMESWQEIRRALWAD